MEPLIFRPSGRYLVKLYVSTAFVYPAIFLVTLALRLDALDGIGAGSLAAILCVTLFVAVGAFGLTTAYFNTIRYEIHEDEIVVHIGLITKSVKHVPFRTITNIKVTRGIFDRILGIGSLSIETAGSGARTSPEEKLDGLEDVQVIYEYVANELRRFRQGMSPTQADSDHVRGFGTSQHTGEAQVLASILEELRIIRALMEEQR